MPNDNMKKKKNRYEDVPIQLVGKEENTDHVAIMRKVYEIILNSKGENDSIKESN